MILHEAVRENCNAPLVAGTQKLLLDIRNEIGRFEVRSAPERAHREENAHTAIVLVEHELWRSAMPHGSRPSQRPRRSAEASRSNRPSGWLRGIPQTEACRLVERLRRVDANTIQYEATIDDPNVYTSSWTVAFPLNRDDRYRIFEYACHEGNYALDNMLRIGTPAKPAR
jgi:hypothetical protein